MASTQQRLRLHRHPISGHAHRVELFLSLLGMPVELLDVDLVKGAQKHPEFLEKNPFGEVPVLEDGETVFADSNAILVYLALTYDASRRWYPCDAGIASQIQRWLSVAAGELLNGPSIARITVLTNRPHDLEKAQAIAHKLFGLLEAQLTSRTYLAADHPTIADIALYTYTAHAPEGGVSLASYPNIRAWLERIEALPGFVGMAAMPALAGD